MALVLVKSYQFSSMVAMSWCTVILKESKTIGMGHLLIELFSS